jgi:hypothetical protein
MTVERRSFLLRIFGLRTRYYSGVAPAALAGHTDRRAIVGVSASNDRLQEVGGVAELGSVTVDLTTFGANAPDNHDPGIALTRVGRRDASWSANVTETVETGDTTIKVDRDPSTLSFPTVVHLGLEAVAVSAGAGVSPDPEHVNPYRFTVTTRGYGGTPVLEHLVTARGAGKPQVVDQVVHWRGRRAVLSYVGDSGTTVEVMRGILGSSPVLSEDGTVVSVELLPLTAVLDQQIPKATRVVHLLDGWHFFDVGLHVEHAQVIRGGAAYRDQLNAAANAGDGSLTVANNTALGNVFSLGRPTPCPRGGLLDLESDYGLPVSALPDLATITLEDAADPPNGHVLGATVRNSPAAELHQVELSTGLQRWPDHLVETINAAWVTGSLAGDDGRWFDLVLRPGQSDFQASPNFTEEAPVELWFWGLTEVVHGWQEDLGATVMHVDATGAIDLVPAPNAGRLTYGLDCFDPDAEPQLSQRWMRAVEVVGGEGAFVIPIRLASSFYQAGETSILIDEELVVPAAGLDIEIRHVDHRTGDEHRRRARVTSCVACSPGWRLVLAAADVRRLPSFGNWPGLDPVEIRLAPVLETFEAVELLLQLLCSGNASNSTYNDLPFGAGLSNTSAGAAEVEVDVASFAAATSASDGHWRLPMPDDQTLADLIDPILKVTATALVMRRNARGEMRLALVSVAPEATVEVVTDLDVFQMGTHPVASTLEEVKTTYAFKVNHDDEGEPQLTVRVQDPAAIVRHGREEVLDLDLRGLQVYVPLGGDPLNAVLPLAARLARLYGEPRRTFRCRVSSEEALVATLGAVVTITSPHAKGAGDAWGLVEVVGRVIAVEGGAWEEGVTLTVVSYGGRRSGWAPAALVQSVAGDTVTVAANAYSAPANPYTGEPQGDVDFFEAGDLVRLVIAENQDAGAHLFEILSVDPLTREIELDGTPPAGTRWLQPCTYADAATRLRKYAFFGQGEIG